MHEHIINLLVQAQKEEQLREQERELQETKQKYFEVSKLEIQLSCINFMYCYISREKRDRKNG